MAYERMTGAEAVKPKELTAEQRIGIMRQRVQKLEHDNRSLLRQRDEYMEVQHLLADERDELKRRVEQLEAALRDREAQINTEVTVVNRLSERNEVLGAALQRIETICQDWRYSEVDSAKAMVRVESIVQETLAPEGGAEGEEG